MPLSINDYKNNKYKITFSTIEDGNMWRSNETRQLSEKNRLQFLQKIGVKRNKLLKIRPSHSPNIDVIKGDFEGKRIFKRYFKKPLIETDFDFYYQGADGILTLDSKYSIGLISGDCTPLIVMHKPSGLFGILHIGMLGALNEMVNTLSPIFKDLQINFNEVDFYLGPSISKEHYNIDSSGLWNAISNQAYSKNPRLLQHIQVIKDGSYFDLHGMIISQLTVLGADKNRLNFYPESTADINVPFFSHYKLKDKEENGRFYTVVQSRT